MPAPHSLRPSVLASTLGLLLSALTALLVARPASADPKAHPAPSPSDRWRQLAPLGSPSSRRPKALPEPPPPDRTRPPARSPQIPPARRVGPSRQEPGPIYPPEVEYPPRALPVPPPPAPGYPAPSAPAPPYQPPASLPPAGYYPPPAGFPPASAPSYAPAGYPPVGFPPAPLASYPPEPAPRMGYAPPPPPPSGPSAAWSAPGPAEVACPPPRQAAPGATSAAAPSRAYAAGLLPLFPATPQFSPDPIERLTAGGEEAGSTAGEGLLLRLLVGPTLFDVDAASKDGTADSLIHGWGLGLGVLGGAWIAPGWVFAAELSASTSFNPQVDGGAIAPPQGQFTFSTLSIGANLIYLIEPLGISASAALLFSQVRLVDQATEYAHTGTRLGPALAAGLTKEWRVSPGWSLGATARASAAWPEDLRRSLNLTAIGGWFALSASYD